MKLTPFIILLYLPPLFYKLEAHFHALVVVDQGNDGAQGAELATHGLDEVEDLIAIESEVHGVARNGDIAAERSAHRGGEGHRLGGIVKGVCASAFHAAHAIGHVAVGVEGESHLAGADAYQLIERGELCL